MTEMMKTKDVKTKNLFRLLFKTDQKVRDGILADMKANGFNKARPIDYWIEGDCTVDGHTRLSCASELGIEEIPVVKSHFVDEADALEYAIKSQAGRRNIPPDQMRKALEVLDRKKPLARDNGKFTVAQNCATAGGKSSETTASILCVSPRLVEQLRTINEHGTDEIKQALDQGDLSISKAYNEVQAMRRAKKDIRKDDPEPAFNATNDNIDWAAWSWNPVTGCKMGCEYCYARDIANRFYPEKFEPTFREDRLKAPYTMKVPDSKEDETSSERRRKRNVFVCSMADLFGSWVPKTWIEKVITACTENPQWNFLFLTKNPKRYLEFEFPKNTFLGTTIDVQKRVAKAEEVFKQLKASVRWLSCEPLLENLEFSSMSMFDLVVIGGQSESTKTMAMQPEWEWVENLWRQARKSKCMIFWKPNLTVRPTELPE